MQKSDDLDAFALDPVGNEKRSGENHQLTSSGNSTTPSGFGMAFQRLDRGKKCSRLSSAADGELSRAQ
jgi:hypothetical protein